MSVRCHSVGQQFAVASRARARKCLYQCPSRNARARWTVEYASAPAPLLTPVGSTPRSFVPFPCPTGRNGLLDSFDSSAVRGNNGCPQWSFSLSTFVVFDYSLVLAFISRGSPPCRRARSFALGAQVQSNCEAPLIMVARRSVPWCRGNNNDLFGH